jgi:hypothetical protein
VTAPKPPAAAAAALASPQASFNLSGGEEAEQAFLSVADGLRALGELGAATNDDQPRASETTAAAHESGWTAGASAYPAAHQNTTGVINLSPNPGLRPLPKPANPPPPPPPQSTKPKHNGFGGGHLRRGRASGVQFSFSLETHTGMSDSTVDERGGSAGGGGSDTIVPFAREHAAEDSFLPGAVYDPSAVRQAWGRPQSFMLDDHDSDEYAETDI